MTSRTATRRGRAVRRCSPSTRATSRTRCGPVSSTTTWRSSTASACSARTDSARGDSGTYQQQARNVRAAVKTPQNGPPDLEVPLPYPQRYGANTTQGDKPMTIFRGTKRPTALLAVGLMAGGLIGLVGVPPAGAAVGVVQISALTGTDGCAPMSDGTVTCAGYNPAGQNGDGTTNQSVLPVTVQDVGGGGQLSSVTQVLTGQDDACARISDGTAVCWGGNGSGQLGDGT